MAFQNYNTELPHGQAFLYVKDPILDTWKPSESYDSAYNRTVSNGFVGQLTGFISSGRLHSVFGYNSGAAQFVKLIDGTTTGGNVIGLNAVGAQSNFNITFPTNGVLVQSGIIVTMNSFPTGSAQTRDGFITVVWSA